MSRLIVLGMKMCLPRGNLHNGYACETCGGAS